MLTTSARRRGAAATALLGVLLVGTAAGSAHADTTRSQQWFLDAMQAENMWRTSTGEGITVALIDTGVDDSNPDLKGRILPGKDLAPAESGDETTDWDGHGTGMAGLIVGTGAYGGGNGAYGLAPGAKVLPIRLPDTQKSGSRFEADAKFEDAVSTAIRYAADHGARIINVSQGITGDADDFPKFTSAVDYALQHGALIFAAAGNDGDEGNKVGFPAATPGVVAVGAIGRDLHRAEFSTHGPQVDVAAPGVDMVHACGGKTGLCKTEGTSDAAALASASAALIWSMHPDWTNNQVLRVMRNTIGGPIDGTERNDSIGYGIVRPRVALKTPGDPGPAAKYPLPDYPAAATPPADASKGARAESTAGAKPAASPDSTDSGSNSLLWIGTGAGVVVVLGVVVAIAVKNRRRDTASPARPVGGPYSYSEQSPYAGQQSYPAVPQQQPYDAQQTGHDSKQP
ncbi:type VII secretion-associated serine protease mycosin [Streptomyces sp. NPDC102406]|uniref:type VII secretion-associated serine protease mycosin n=1 Tax=Streptomyces sp. NPDC102406 TaxID=3366171 RepID=UPI0038298180